LFGHSHPSPASQSALSSLLFASVFAVLLATIPATLHALGGESAGASSGLADRVAREGLQPVRARPVRWPAVAWRSSRAVGLPTAGGLVRGVKLPAEGEHFFTWDAILKRSPNRAWRRYATDRLVRVLLRVVSAFRAAHPESARIGIGDLSRPHGGDFGPRFGGLGHGSHQNGLDADVYYPRLDRLERGPQHASQIDRAFAQDLVDRFVRAGAESVFVGPRTKLRGRAGVVQVLAHHDDHLHVRLRP
jgi:murein endopeptidase